MARVVLANGPKELTAAVAVASALEGRGVTTWLAARDAASHPSPGEAQRAAIAEAEVVVLLLPPEHEAASPIVEDATRAATPAQRSLAFHVAPAVTAAEIEAIARAAADALPSFWGTGGRRDRKSARSSARVFAFGLVVVLAVGGAASWFALPSRTSRAPAPLAASASAGPADAAVWLSGQQGPHGWIVVFHLRDEKEPRTISYRINRQGAFTTLPVGAASMDLGRIPQPITFEVSYVSRAGATKGPFVVAFDPVAQAVASFKPSMMDYDWVTLRIIHDYQRNVDTGMNAIFGVLAQRPAIRAIRYGADVPTPNRLLAFRPSDELIDELEAETVRLPVETRFVSVELELRDGSKTTRIFPYRPDPQR